MLIERRQSRTLEFQEVVGYRFLISAGFADVLLLFNYGVWPGLTILFKSEIIPKCARHWLQLYLDWAWFSMVWHYAVVGWSRWSAIRTPHTFRCQRRRYSYALCGCCYVVALVEVLATHFQPWYVTFYYEPSSYGMLAEDFALYLSGGQSAMFLTYHVAAIIPPIIFYTWSLVLLINRRRTAIKSHTHIHVAQSNIESRLLLPCVINMIVFIAGQIVITVGTGEGKWAGCMVMLVFCTNSALNPLLLLLCSESIRKQLLITIGIRRSSFSHPEKCSSIIYRNPIITRSKEETIQSPLMGVQVRLSPSPSNSEPSTHL
ncbi:hypothetical protein NECAME_03750 [Necator americanus]|uniref:7TM GPCR serpentine receptor class x (Srx) domain-containing protein n=1 Tax=Necator americanus TaxID=51031 RepID=W2T0M7_NECAM|nr:hypothetical protein NECAME_03750 [Necator americanus]ETN75560.1 hypothetical protein NECAME_03750 [Necator americanus]